LRPFFGVGLADTSIIFSLAPEATTTPIALALAQEPGGVPALTAALAIAGGYRGGSRRTDGVSRLRVEDWRAQGLAAGVALSGVTAAQIAPLSEVASVRCTGNRAKCLANVGAGAANRHTVASRLEQNSH
jgi:putative effector of murein hydrolase